MALNKANITWSCKQITKMADNGTFKFDNIIQRSYVWEDSRKSNLIHSIIEGFPIPAFYAMRIDGKTYDFLDGKQRINAIRGFIDNEYCITGMSDTIKYTDVSGNEKEIFINGKFFKDLPEEIQDTIKDYHLTIYFYEDITPEQIRLMFAKLNNGKPLSTKDRNIANCVDIETVSDIGNHVLFTTAMSEKAIESRKHLPIIMKIWMMINNDINEISFDSKKLNATMKETWITAEEKDKISRVLDKIYNIYNELGNYSNAKTAKSVRKKMTSETHMVSLIPFIVMAIEESISDKLMADFMVELYGGDTIVSNEYSDACKNGSAKNANIVCRNNEIEKVWKDYFSVEDSDDIAYENNLVPMPGLEKMERFYNGDNSSAEWDNEFRCNQNNNISPDFINEPEEICI